MHKKGDFNVVIAFILALVVVFVFASIAWGGILQGKPLKTLTGLPDKIIQDPFKFNFKESDDVFINSMNALVTGINAVAAGGEKGKVEGSKDDVAAAEKAKEDSTIYGDCQGGKYIGSVKILCDGTKCTICNFDMLQKDTSMNSIYANGDPDYVIFYELFPEEEERYWSINKNGEHLFNSITAEQFNLKDKFALKINDQKISVPPQFFMDLGISAQRASKTGNVLGIKGEVEDLFNLGFTKTNEKNVDKIYTDYFDYAIKDSAKILVASSGKITRINILSGMDGLKDDVGLMKDAADVSAKISSFSDFVNSLPQNLKILGNGYNLLVALALPLAREQSMNDKFALSQSNAIIIKKPYEKAAVPDKSIIPPLSDEAKKYFVALNRVSFLQRFSLASPCKAELTITKQPCTCYIPEPNEDYEIYKSDSGEIPVLKSSIKTDSAGNKDYSNAIKACADMSSLIVQNNAKSYPSQCIAIEVKPIGDNQFCYGKNKDILKNKNLFIDSKYSAFIKEIMLKVSPAQLLNWLSPQNPTTISLGSKDSPDPLLDAGKDIPAQYYAFLGDRGNWPND